MSGSLDHPYQDLQDGAWLRGNLHAHPRPRKNPASMPARYAEFGYGFVGLTEHDQFYSLDEIASWEDHWVVLVPGNEVSKGGPHILHVGADRRVEPHQDRQTVVDQINTTSGFAIVNHPNLGAEVEHCSLELMQQWTGYLGLEIFNASGLRSGDRVRATATDKWDALLSQGRRLWGFASDDYHQPEHAAMGWNVAYVKDRSLEGVMEALQRGRFYASNGVAIERIEVNGLQVRIVSSDALRVVAQCDHGRELAAAAGPVFEVEVPEEATYVRFECWAADGNCAWTQPFWVVL